VGSDFPPAAPCHCVFAIPFASVSLRDITKAEVDEIILWLTGYTAREFAKHLKDGTDFEAFYGQARLNPARTLITGTVCGVRVETIEDPLMRELRYLDKLIDELAKGREMGRILRKAE
jgi:hypothetical protein